MSNPFPGYVPQQGHVIRIYYPRPWKNAYVFIHNGLVTHATESLAFALGWTREKLIARAEKVGFSHTRIDAMKPRPTWLTVRPAPLQPVIPTPPKWDDMSVSPQKPKRDAKGRFIKKGSK